MNSINAWSRSIVISVILTVIIEMILPENNSKKYIKIILGIFVVYSIISPIFDFFSSNSVDGLIDKGEAVIEASSSNVRENGSYKSYGDYADMAVKNIYVQSLQTEINNELQRKNYIPETIEISILDDGTYNINSIRVKIKDKKEVDKDENKNKNNKNKQAQSIVETVKQIVINANQNNSKEDKNDKDSIIDENDKSNIKKLLHDNFGVDENKIIIT